MVGSVRMSGATQLRGRVKLHTVNFSKMLAVPANGSFSNVIIEPSLYRFSSATIAGKNSLDLPRTYRAASCVRSESKVL